MNLFIAPHPDDECLWGAYTIQRELNNIVVAVIKVQRELWRCDESRAAMEWLGLPQQNLKFYDRFDGIPMLDQMGNPWEKVYVTAMQGGHPFHDEVCETTIRKHGDRVVLYSAYTKKKENPPFGRWKVESTERMQKRKVEALLRYESQQRISAVHFGLKCKDEYYF